MGARSRQCRYYACADWLLWIITSRLSCELAREFQARLSIEFPVAVTSLYGLLQDPLFRGDDDGRKQDGRAQSG